jgi:hypothetical protein
MFRGSEKGTGYALHSPVSPSLPLRYVTVCHHISTGVPPVSLQDYTASNTEESIFTITVEKTSPLSLLTKNIYIS